MLDYISHVIWIMKRSQFPALHYIRPGMGQGNGILHGHQSGIGFDNGLGPNEVVAYPGQPAACQSQVIGVDERRQSQVRSFGQESGAQTCKRRLTVFQASLAPFPVYILRRFIHNLFPVASLERRQVQRLQTFEESDSLQKIGFAFQPVKIVLHQTRDSFRSTDTTDQFVAGILPIRQATGIPVKVLVTEPAQHHISIETGRAGRVGAVDYNFIFGR